MNALDTAKNVEIYVNGEPFCVLSNPVLDVEMERSDVIKTHRLKNGTIKTETLASKYEKTKITISGYALFDDDLSTIQCCDGTQFRDILIGER